MRCSRCGLLGHMKTNSKKCPIFHIESNEPTISEKEGYIKSEGN